MPDISEANKTSLSQLVNEYNALPWYKKFFYPGALGNALGKYNEIHSLVSAFAVCDTFLNKTWFFQRWFFSSLVVFSKSELVGALYALKTAGLLTGNAGEANFNAVASHRNSCGVYRALSIFNTASLLTQNQFDLVVKKYKDILLDPVTDNIWFKLANHHLTGKQFECILEMCQENSDDLLKARSLFIDYVKYDISGESRLNIDVGKRSPSFQDPISSFQDPIRMNVRPIPNAIPAPSKLGVFANNSADIRTSELKVGGKQPDF